MAIILTSRCYRKINWLLILEILLIFMLSTIRVSCKVDEGNLNRSISAELDSSKNLSQVYHYSNSLTMKKAERYVCSRRCRKCLHKSRKKMAKGKIYSCPNCYCDDSHFNGGHSQQGNNIPTVMSIIALCLLSLF